MATDRDRKPLSSRHTPRASFDHMKTPTWFKVAGGIALMVSAGMLAFGVWAVYELVTWAVSK